MKKLIVCESCDVEYTIQYDMEEEYYKIISRYNKLWKKKMVFK